MHEGTRQLLESMADTVDLRDPYTGGHSRRVTELSAGILRELRVQGPEAALILAAARVHDIGKIGIDDAVLKKPGPLTPEERAIMELHPEHGANLLRRYPDFERGVQIVLHHHESWDGTGYPHRLQREEIPFGSRVIAVTDSFDAMTSDRPYRRGMPAPRAAQILREGRGTQWDATLVDAFLRSIADQLERPTRPMLQIVPDAESSSDVAPMAGMA
jgi:HD-GYP domain-containing protein (c-di-GMP phosphodiesterase class II)